MSHGPFRAQRRASILKALALAALAALALAAVAIASCTSSPASTPAPAPAQAPAQAQAEERPWLNAVLAPEARAELLLARMTPMEKFTMVHGGSAAPFVGHVNAIPRLGIPELNMSDGPVGVGNGKTNVTAFPSPLTLAMSWDADLALRYGAALGEEFLGKGANVALAPMMNMNRVPQAGRNFEGFGEDPFLTARLAAAEIRGIQGTGVIATAKHYIDNDQEFARMTISAEVDERTQHEIYLPPFRAAVEAGVGAVMGAYNRVNGIYACQNAEIQNLFLKEELGFSGWIMSDWGATHSTVASALNGLDMEMPGQDFFGGQLALEVNAGRIPRSRLDDMVRRILTSMFRMGLFDREPAGSPTADVRSEAHTRIARQTAAQGLVLLKNENAAVPLDASSIRSIAVFGSVAGVDPVVVGGGSGYVIPPYVVTALQGITRRAGDGIRVTYIAGDASTGLPVGAECLRAPDGSPGLVGEYFGNKTLSGTPVLTRTDPTVDFSWHGASPGSGVPATNWSARWTGALVPAATDAYRLMLSSDDGSRLFLNGVLVLDNWGDHALQTVQADVRLEAGVSYPLRIEFYQSGGDDDVRFTWQTLSNLDFDAVAEAARAADAAVVVVGLTSSEGGDRSSLSLPGTQDALVSAVAAANPRTIVVVYAPAQVLMPWAEEAAAIFYTGMPGQEAGNALADVLFGDLNPSGRLPMTIARAVSDYPASTREQYPGVDSRAIYSENLLVGYRHFDARGIEPLFAFGHGLSYTSFTYSNLAVAPEGGAAPARVTVSLDVANTGGRDGAEVVQLYVGYPAAAGEPPRNLKAFARVELRAGETRRVEFALERDDWSYWDSVAHGWTVAAGSYRVMVGASSRDLRLNGSFESAAAAPSAR